MVGLDGTCPWCQRDVRFQRVWSLPWTRPGVTEVHEVVSCPREECAGATYRTGQGVSTPQGWQLDTLTAQWPPLGSTPAKPGKLANQIKELVHAGNLHPQLGEWADAVRLFGNEGAHPGDDGLDTVSQQDAEDALSFLDQLVDWTYVAPWKLQQSRARTTQTP